MLARIIQQVVLQILNPIINSPEAIAKDMSPLSVQEYLPQTEVYDQLMPQARGGGKMQQSLPQQFKALRLANILCLYREVRLNEPEQYLTELFSVESRLG